MEAHQRPSADAASRLGQTHRSAADLLASAREAERSGCIAEAAAQYERAIQEAEASDQRALLAEALRRLAVVRHERNEYDGARDLCNRSLVLAEQMGSFELAAEALNTLGCMLLREGVIADAEGAFKRALARPDVSRGLRARVERNLGIIANIQGDLDEARDRYTKSLDESRAIGDENGCAHALHNLGIVSTHLNALAEADEYFTKSLEIAERACDMRLRGLCLLNHADLDATRQRFEDARQKAEGALAIFDQLGARSQKSAAYRVIGVVYRETGKLTLAESRLRSAITLAEDAGSVLPEAEATRDLALVYQAMGRNQEALLLLNRSHALFRRLDARRDLVNVDSKVRQLEESFLVLVREWGQSIESSDSYTFGHCGRVADNAVAVARELGLDNLAQTTIRLGAYLHDLGKVKVPHEILNKPGPLTRDEFEVVQMHPVWGMELLDGVEFPWDIKPIIRWHHEKHDGTGYPDRLRGDEIPLTAQIVGIADVYDALTTTRAYRPAMTHEAAVAEILKTRSAWSNVVVDAFVRAMPNSIRPVRAVARPSIAA
jgi:putative nucleotidyltransferase with HDIG domain